MNRHNRIRKRMMGHVGGNLFWELYRALQTMRGILMTCQLTSKPLESKDCCQIGAVFTWKRDFNFILPWSRRLIGTSVFANFGNDQEMGRLSALVYGLLVEIDSLCFWSC